VSIIGLNDPLIRAFTDISLKYRRVRRKRLWAGWIKMPLGTKVGLNTGDCLLDGDPAPLPTKVLEPPPQSIFGPFLLWPNGWMHQDATWYGGRPQPRGLSVRWDPAVPLPKRRRSPPIFDLCPLWPNGWMDQDGTWRGGRLWSSPHCAGWGHSSPPQKGDRAPNFRPIFIVAKRLDASTCHLVWR